MKNSVSDRHLYVNDTDGDDDVVNEEGALEEGHKEDDDSDESESSCGSPRRSIPNSYTTSWPQSYRQSIDIYTSVTPPTIGFLGTPTLSRLSGSFLTTSFRGRQPPEVLSSLVKPLIPSPLAPERRSSQALLPRIPSKHKVIKSYQELPPPSSNCSYGQAVLNGVNVLCGVGILSTPYAVKEGGWIGLVVLFVFAVLAAYTGLLLRRCLDSEPGLETYPDIGQAAFGTFGRVFISVVLYVELFGCCVEYIILEGDNLSSLFPHVHLDVAGFRLSPQLVFAALTTLIVLPTTWLRDLSVLSYISAGGVVASILVVLCLFWIGAVDKIGPISGGTLIDFKGFPIALGLYGYCYSGHGVFPNIYSSLKNPNQYPAVVFTAFGVCSVMFAGVAVVGYLMFGESTESQFTLNLPHGLMASNIAVWTTVVNPISNPLALSLEELIPSNRLKTFAYPIMIRTALVISTLVVGLSVPFFGLVMSLIGSLLTMLVTLILPCACYLSILKGRVSPIEGAFCGLVILIGLVASSFGTFSAVCRIIQRLEG
ncbi:amino acid transporter AVT1C-like isoform X2 [Wolffia australiana]